MTWFAVYTEPQREQFARERLEAEGITVFYPHIPAWIGLSSHKARLVYRPYFPRYLFVDAVDDDNMTQLGGLWLVPGVIGPVKSTNGRPFRIAQKALQPLLDLADVLGAIHAYEAVAPQYRLHRGNRVKIAEGNPLRGMVATVEDVDGDRIAATISGLFGRVMIAPDMVGEVLPGTTPGPNRIETPRTARA